MKELLFRLLSLFWRFASSFYILIWILCFYAHAPYSTFQSKLVPQTKTKSVSHTRNWLYYEMSNEQAVQAEGGSERDEDRPFISQLIKKSAVSKEDWSGSWLWIVRKKFRNPNCNILLSIFYENFWGQISWPLLM